MSVQFISVWPQIKSAIISSQASSGIFDAEQTKSVLIKKVGNVNNYIEASAVRNIANELSKIQGINYARAKVIEGIIQQYIR